jgi:hypothetical protein
MSGEKNWPPVGRNRGRQLGDSVAVYGEISMAAGSVGAVATWAGRKNPPSHPVLSVWQDPVLPGGISARASMGSSEKDRLLDRGRRRDGFAATLTTGCSLRCAGIGVGPALDSSSLSWLRQRGSWRLGSFLRRSG